MPFIAAIGTYPPCWGSALRRVAVDGVDHSGFGLKSVMSQHQLDTTTFPATIGRAKRVLAMGDPAPSRNRERQSRRSLPLNSSGVFKAKGPPPGAPGVAQCVELFQQLRGDAVNQVDGARIALAHNIGGPTAVSAVTILEGPGTNGS